MLKESQTMGNMLAEEKTERDCLLFPVSMNVIVRHNMEDIL